MEKDVNTVDVVIKIRKLDDYRTRPKTPAPAEPVQRSVNRTSDFDKISSDTESFESRVLSVIERHHKGIKARNIADKLGVDKSKCVFRRIVGHQFR